MFKKLLGVCGLAMLLFVGAVFAQETPVLDILVYDSYAVSEDLVVKFEAENNVKLQFIEAGDGTELINRAILTKDAPLADVIVGMNSVLIPRALDNGILESYASPLLASINEKYLIDPENRALPFNHGDVCLNYDIEYFTTNQLAVPTTLDDLTGEAYRGLLAIENPVSSTPGLAFMLLTVDLYGEDGFVDYWQKLLDNGAEVVPDWSTAYFTNFTAGGGGHQPIVVSYAASPAAAPLYADEPMDEAPTAAVIADQTCFNMVEYAGILKGTDQPELAQKFIDAILGTDWQSDMPALMFVYPVNVDAEVPEIFETFAPIAENPVSMDPAFVADNFEKWLQLWSSSVQISQ